jgi:hypothetical protein
MIICYMTNKFKFTCTYLALQAGSRFGEEQHDHAGSHHDKGVESDGGQFCSIRLEIRTVGDEVVIAPVAQKHYRDGGKYRGRTNRKIDKNCSGTSMVENCLVKAPRGKPMISEGAIEVDASSASRISTDALLPGSSGWFSALFPAVN